LSTVCLSVYSIAENIYYSQLSSVAILLQPEPNCCTSYSTRKGLGSLSLSAIVLRSPTPTCLVLTLKEARSYFASTIHAILNEFHPYCFSTSPTTVISMPKPAAPSRSSVDIPHQNSLSISLTLLHSHIH
jgi:hypothetical protein